MRKATCRFCSRGNGVPSYSRISASRDMCPAFAGNMVIINSDTISKYALYFSNITSQKELLDKHRNYES